MDFGCQSLKLAKISVSVLSCDRDSSVHLCMVQIKICPSPASPELLPQPWLPALNSLRPASTSLRPASSLQTCLGVTGLLDDPWSPDLLCLAVSLSVRTLSLPACLAATLYSPPSTLSLSSPAKQPWLCPGSVQLGLFWTSHMPVPLDALWLLSWKGQERKVISQFLFIFVGFYSLISK